MAPRGKPKPRTKVVINYPPVPTRKWIPPDQRPRKKPPPPYVKPKGVTQRLKISSLKKVWRQYMYFPFPQTAILTGHFSQTSKKYCYVTNGYQGACNCAVACTFAFIYKMDNWNRYYLDRILNFGDQLYVKSIHQEDGRCLDLVPPEMVFNSFYLYRAKVLLSINVGPKVEVTLPTVTEEKVKNLMGKALTDFFKMYPSGIFAMRCKYLAIWNKDGAFYVFDPSDHTEDGHRWDGVIGDGFCILYRSKTIEMMIENICKNVEWKIPHTRFEIIECTVSRITHINTIPPSSYQEYMALEAMDPSKAVDPDDLVEEVKPIDVLAENIKEYMKEYEDENFPNKLRIIEISPEVTKDLPPEKRPSWLQGEIEKDDCCMFPIPHKPQPEKISFYLEVISEKIYILRASTCQTDPSFSKYLGRQSMGNAISALVMLRMYKSKVWVPRIVNMILKYGDILYSNAMNSIPRTQSLKLSDFQRLTEVEKRQFSPVIQDYVIVGKLQSLEYDVLDLFPALENYLLDHECCVVLGPITMAVWTEDGEYYYFDPNERDKAGKAIPKSVDMDGQSFKLDQQIQGTACVVRFCSLKDLVDLYMSNVEKAKKTDPFYISSVRIENYVEVPEPWFNFKGKVPGKWILRGTRMQASKKFPPELRNYQSPAISFIALAYQGRLAENEWNAETVDTILELGNNLYKESLATLENNGKFISKMLTVSEVNTKFVIGDKLADFEVGECYINGLINTGTELGVKNLIQGLEEFFQDNDLGVVTSHNISVAIWKKEGVFYTFDSHPRDDKGLATYYGTAIVTRTVTLEELAGSLEVNLSPRKEDFYNISWIKVAFYDLADEGLIRPSLNHYTKINDNKAILRSLYSEISPKYEINCEKQTVPMGLMALAFNKLKPAKDWTKADLDEILNKGDAFYVETMNDILKEELRIDDDGALGAAEGGGESGSPTPPPPESPPPAPAEGMEGMDEVVEEEEEEEKDGVVDTNNVNTEFHIGLNKMKIEFNTVSEGNIREALRESLRTFFEAEQTEDYFNQELIIETKPLTVVVWRDDKVFYYFDAKPRDNEGVAIGKEDWPEYIEEIPEEEIIEEEFYDEEEEEGGEENEEEGQGEEEEGPADDLRKYFDALKEQRDEEEFVEAVSIKPIRIPKSASYWREQEMLRGRGCTVWFVRLDDLIEHIMGNIPPVLAAKKEFVMKSVNMVNTVVLKERLQPDDMRNDVYAGDWYDFYELDHGKWISRGTMNLMNEMFPAENRGKQQITTSLVAIAVAFAFSMLCFDKFSVDTILIYGDKLFSYMKKMRKKFLQSMADTKLKDEDIDWLVMHEEYDLKDVIKRICIWKFFIEIQVEEDFIKGDINSEVEDILNIERGLEQFFAEYHFGLMQCKDLTVAIWRGEKIYYMFDGMNRGPNGIVSPNGTGCVTRYLDVRDMGKVFLANLPRFGKNTFSIHKVTMEKDLCPREREVKELRENPKTIGVPTGGFRNVVAGKCIVRGGTSLRDPKFTLAPPLMGAPIAVIALTMTLIHKANTWSKPLIDEILQLGSELAEDSINELGYLFNPWDDTLDISKVKNDYTIGVRKANCEFRAKDQRGIIDTKSKYDLNLRQGLELFFEENTHGVLTTPTLCLAIWEEEEEKNEPLLYMYDPYPRGPTGMPLEGGTACVMTFVNCKIAADHVIGCILDPEEKVKEFTIVPVEIVVGNLETRRKMKKMKTVSEVGVLPRCSKLVADEQKRMLRKIAEDYRKRKAARQQEKIGRRGYFVMKNGDALIRGYKSQNSKRYNEHSRNNQDITNCIMAIVMHVIMTVDTWSYKNVDLILDCGDQLYIDSYIAYNPKDKKLGLENIVRKFCLKNLKIHVTVYKSIIKDVFNVNNLSRVLNVYFLREEFCMLSYRDQWVSLFFKAGYFYMFDPHERDIEGNKLTESKEGTAVVVRFDNLNSLALKVVQNLYVDAASELDNEFFLWLIAVDSKEND